MGLYHHSSPQAKKKAAQTIAEPLQGPTPPLAEDHETYPHRVLCRHPFRRAAGAHWPLHATNTADASVYEGCRRARREGKVWGAWAGLRLQTIASRWEARLLKHHQHDMESQWLHAVQPAAHWCTFSDMQSVLCDN